MRLDRDLVRDLLFALEAKQDFQIRTRDELIPEGRERDEVGYALLKMYEAGFITGEVIRSSTTPERIIEVMPFELTFKGHEFLDTVRDNEVWRRTKQGVEKAGGASITFVWELAKAYGKQALNERLGIQIP